MSSEAYILELMTLVQIYSIYLQLQARPDYLLTLDFVELKKLT